MQRGAAHTKADRKLLKAMQRKLERGEPIKRKTDHRVHSRMYRKKELPPARLPPRAPSKEERMAALRAAEWRSLGGPPELKEKAHATAI